MKQFFPHTNILSSVQKVAFGLCLLFIAVVSGASTHEDVRTYISLNNDWKRASGKDSNVSFINVERKNFNDKSWHSVNVPDNANTYEGVQRYKHNDFHGDAFYRKTFSCSVNRNKRYFLFFEGVGAYATVWLNEKLVGKHDGGRTSFTLDVTGYLNNDSENLVVVKASHPAFIKDLPWVCGGCADEIGFSEGSQPTGIFRPVTLIVTNSINVTPFGVHIWNDNSANASSATLHINTEIKNFLRQQQSVTVQQELKDANNRTVFTTEQSIIIPADSTVVIKQKMQNIQHPVLWNPEHPYLYAVVTTIHQQQNIIDVVTNRYGIRTISWPDKQHKQFILNGKPVFINGTAEYEHLLGKSHAFSKEEITARIMQVKAAGFNAFRDAHQPHNLLYGKLTDEKGLLWWPQFAAHIWYDTPAFKDNFIRLLRDWVKERRNDPSVILWGLENESTLPVEFARQCSEVIRSMDPTASLQRKITTCNGGHGTDWNVPQNWSGTYGGDTAKYGRELQKEILVGEYGAWRSIGAHAETDTAKGIKFTENYMTAVLETKVRLSESVKDEVAGQFNWLLYSHENPGRVQSGESMRDISRIGPVNYKGLFTLWGEPTDALYMYRANYIDAGKEPMVYIVSHTWPDRWTEPGLKNNIIVYSNCDEVELFNDIEKAPLGKRQRNGVGTHFTWDNVNIQYNVLYAIGYVKGKAVARDVIVLHHLPAAPHFNNLYTHLSNDVIQPSKNLAYLYRVNCGGNNYKDAFGNTWLADIPFTYNKKYGSSSWADDYANVPAAFASQGNNNDPVKGTAAWPLFQSFRYGLNRLKYDFPVANGDYVVELYFTEPWYGLGNINAKAWRSFDIAINDSIVDGDVDAFAEAGYNHAIKKRFSAHVRKGKITISFPNEKAGQAVLMAIAIAVESKTVPAVHSSAGIIQNLQPASENSSVEYWMNTGDTVFTDRTFAFSELPSALYGAEWIKTSLNNSNSLQTCSFTVSTKADVYVAYADSTDTELNTGFSTTNTNIYTGGTDFKKWIVYKKRFGKKSKIMLQSRHSFIIAVNDAVDLPASYDLRNAVTYHIKAATIKGSGFTKDSMYNKYAVHFSASTNDTVQWKIAIGVAGMYAVRLRYRTENNSSADIKMVIQDASGNTIKEEILHLPSYQKEKWGTFEASTGSYINAGNYAVSFYTVNAKGLSLSSIEIQ